MGRLTLNVLLSFAQFEREVTGERIRDKVAASKRKGMWMGGAVPLGYSLVDKLLVVNEEEAVFVRNLFERYCALGSVSCLKDELEQASVRGRSRLHRDGSTEAKAFSRGALYAILNRRLYLGEIGHKDEFFEGQHDAIVPADLWHRAQTRLGETICQRYKALAPQEMDAAARRILAHDGLVWVMVGDAAVVKPQLEKLGLLVQVRAAE